MSYRAKLSSAEVRAGLSHPVIDSDGHVVELQPVLREYIAQVAGQRVAKRFERIMTTGGGPWGWYAQTWKQRRARRTLRPPFWTIPARNATDRATGHAAHSHAQPARLVWHRLRGHLHHARLAVRQFRR